MMLGTHCSFLRCRVNDRPVCSGQVLKESLTHETDAVTPYSLATDRIYAPPAMREKIAAPVGCSLV